LFYSTTVQTIHALVSTKHINSTQGSMYTKEAGIDRVNNGHKQQKSYANLQSSFLTNNLAFEAQSPRKGRTSDEVKHSGRLSEHQSCRTDPAILGVLLEVRRPTRSINTVNTGAASQVRDHPGTAA